MRVGFVAAWACLNAYRLHILRGYVQDLEPSGLSKLCLMSVESSNTYSHLIVFRRFSTGSK